MGVELARMKSGMGMWVKSDLNIPKTDGSLKLAKGGEVLKILYKSFPFKFSM